MNEEPVKELLDKILNDLPESKHDKFLIPNILIPLIRKIMPTMIAQDLVGVQPMMGIVKTNRDRFVRAFNVTCDNPGMGNPGQIFTMKPKYGVSST